MRFTESISAFFSHSKWGMQLLLLSVCMLIPLVGPIVMQGYLIEVIARQVRDRQQSYPAFDFDRFGRYLGHGIWPFLVGLVASLLFMPVVALALAPLLSIPMLELDGPITAAPIATAVLLSLVVVVALSLFLVPMYLRAAFTQTFSAAFSWGFIKDFVGRVWGQIILMYLFLTGISLVAMPLGYATCGIGMYPVVSVLTFAVWQLYRQLYELYLSRGGEPIEIRTELYTDKETPGAG